VDANLSTPLTRFVASKGGAYADAITIHQYRSVTYDRSVHPDYMPLLMEEAHATRLFRSHGCNLQQRNCPYDITKQRERNAKFRREWPDYMRPYCREWWLRKKAAALAADSAQ
jgi:hypothetical protein